jgi:D-aminopeptidase
MSRKHPFWALALIAALPLGAVGLRAQAAGNAPEARPRARALGIHPGPYSPGPLNAITDVAGVEVGQVTIVRGENVRTGVTVILPHADSMFQNKVAASVYVSNAFGKLVGSTQVNELGQIETPIVLTNTLSVWDAAAALMDWELALPRNEDVRSINPVVGETNDGWLNDIRGRHVKPADILKALANARGGPVAEGAVGAGEGTIAFGWKGGIGTSSRHLPASDGGYTIGVLVQTNFGGRLAIAGVPVWRYLEPPGAMGKRADGSCMIVVATDAPLTSRQLHRLARRAIFGMARAGATGSNGSGDYVIAFSTTDAIPAEARILPPIARLNEDALSPLFEAVIDATEEAIDDSLLRATTVQGRDGHVASALPIDRLRELLKQYNRQ